MVNLTGLVFQCLVYLVCLGIVGFIWGKIDVQLAGVPRGRGDYLPHCLQVRGFVSIWYY